MQVHARLSLAGMCAGLAVLPDLDLVYPPIHRMMTHSVLAAVLTGVIAAIVVPRTTSDFTRRWAVVCALAYASHMLLDWVGGDTKIPAGIQLLWPFSDRWFLSSWEVFRATDLGGFFRPHIMWSNSMAILRELLFLGPVALVAFYWRGRTSVAPGQTTPARHRRLLPEN